MIQKIVYLVEWPFNDRDYDRFGIATFKKNGYEVEVWDFAPFLNHRLNILKIAPVAHGDCHRPFFSIYEASAKLAKLPGNTFIICMIDYKLSTLRIFRTISRLNLSYSVFMANAIPCQALTAGEKHEKSLNIVKRLRNLKDIDFKNYIFQKIPYPIFGINPADIILASGENSLMYNYPKSADTEILWLHTLDYDNYLKEKTTSPLPEPHMAVFLDEFLPLHPEYIAYGVEPPTRAEEYYPLLCTFFDFLEKQYNYSVIIAAHPRSDYDKRPPYFGNRPVIKGKTPELVKKSRFVITSESTSINYAVLYDKPVVLITTDRLNQSNYRAYNTAFSSWLGKKVHNLNEPLAINMDEELSVDPASYIRYKKAYIKKEGSPELPFWQILSNRLEKW